MITLAHGLRFADLYSIDGANRIDRLFVDHLRATDAALYGQLDAARASPDALGSKAEAVLLVTLAPHLEDFLAQLFGIAPEVQALEAKHHELAPLFAVKRQFVQRKAANAYKADEAATFDGPALRVLLEGRIDARLEGQAGELAFAQAVTRWLQDEPAHADDLELAARYAAWALHTPAGRAATRGGVLFRAPRKLDYIKLVPLEAVSRNGVTALAQPKDHPLR
ncbi:MAG TPA: pyridine nucleotide-disulfide oxidoreductase, partial [Casimicrobiaceae bacterium]